MESNVINLTAIQNYLLSQQKDIWSTTQDSNQLHRKKKTQHFHIAYYKYCCCLGLEPIFQFKTYLYKKTKNKKKNQLTCTSSLELR